MAIEFYPWGGFSLRFYRAGRCIATVGFYAYRIRLGHWRFPATPRGWKRRGWIVYLKIHRYLNACYGH